MMASTTTSKEVIIRSWHPSDDADVWSVLQEGSHSNINATFRLYLNKPVLRALSIIVIAVGLFNGLPTLYLIPCFIFGIFILYGLAVLSSYIYLYSSTLADVKDIHETYLSNADNHFWVAEYDGKIVGTIAIVHKDQSLHDNNSHLSNENIIPTSSQQKDAWLRRMVVRTKYRGMGIAKCLVNEAIEYCRNRRYDGVFLITTEVHHAARSLYEKIGFELKAVKPYKYLKGLVKVKTYEYYMQL